MSRGTRKRAATHGTCVVSSAKCPKCRGQYVVQTKVLGVLLRLCGYCGEQWEPKREAGR